MKFYSYNPISGEYVGSGNAQKSPLGKSAFLLPANATWEKPKEQSGTTPIWNGSAWVNLEDYRGEVYYDKQTKAKFVIDDFGEIPDRFTALVPGQYDVWENGKWQIANGSKPALIKAVSEQIDREKDLIIASGIDFTEGDNTYNFPLHGDMYALNMQGANLYLLSGASGGREFYTSDGKYAQITNVAGLLQAGEAIMTPLLKNSIDRKAELQNKTAQELYEILNA